MKKILALVLAFVLVIGATVAGTMAYLTDKEEVMNTFTVGDIDITLTETPNASSTNGGEPDHWEGIVVPGVNLSKDPVVKVDADSVDCWLFVKLTGGGTWPNGVAYNIANGWTALPGNADVYYREVAHDATDREFQVLAGNNEFESGVITVANTITKDQLNAITAPFTLTVTAYACQKAGFDTAASAWQELTRTAS